MGRKSINYISIPVEVNPLNHLTAMKTEYKAGLNRDILPSAIISRSSVSKYMLW